MAYKYIMYAMRNIFLVLLMAVGATAFATGGIQMRQCRRVCHQSPSVNTARTRQRADGMNPYLGKRRQLVVLVAFSDKPFSDETPLERWNAIFNEPLFNEPPFVGSVRDYFFDQSYGLLELTFDLQYVMLDESSTRYQSTATDDENSQYLVSDLVDVLQTRPIDWAPYDWNSDGYIDHLLIIYAGKGQNDGGGKTTIWPHQGWMSEHADATPLTVTSQGNTYLIDCYCCIQEQAGRTGHSTFGTICHEYSHCFGLPDFYYENTSYVNDWDLMDRGNYNGKGYCPPSYSVAERMFMGWISPTELTAPTTIYAMPATSSQSEAYLVRSEGHPQEYYILENRQPTGWDQSVPGSGVLIFHVYFDEEEWRTDCPNTPEHLHYTIFHADNQSHSPGADWPYPYKDNNALTDTSKPAATLLFPRADGALLMSKPITDISVSGGLASFCFMPATGITPLPTGQSDRLLYRIGPVLIIRDDSGTVKKVIK